MSIFFATWDLFGFMINKLAYLTKRKAVCEVDNLKILKSSFLFIKTSGNDLSFSVEIKENCQNQQNHIISFQKYHYLIDIFMLFSKKEELFKIHKSQVKFKPEFFFLSSYLDFNLRLLNKSDRKLCEFFKLTDQKNQIKKANEEILKLTQQLNYFKPLHKSDFPNNMNFLTLQVVKPKDKKNFIKRRFFYIKTYQNGYVLVLHCSEFKLMADIDFGICFI
ncbi:hypothetical protein BpHYR1_005158 [Brachionus plicatilis]|uniref:Uncharacterized protein n=1 Tax=Brachionus plicatilis TaxID=10195 RepID=A0A3M7R0W4_BRAPC|nr:hypothetical protein BpHYR1_005158 [Brachionus plicatilis]